MLLMCCFWVAKKDDKKVDWMVKISARKNGSHAQSGCMGRVGAGFCYAGGVN
jgi:hypothetical protein